MAHESSILPSITSVINSAEKRKEFTTIKVENPDIYNILPEIKEEVLDLDLTNVESNPTIEEKPINRAETISKMIKKHYEFIEVSRNVTTDQFLIAAAQLCHMDTSLAEQVWLQFFPKIWQTLEEEQRNVLVPEILPFITSGTHIVQKECYPSAINTFVEALSRCNPPIQIAP